MKKIIVAGIAALAMSMNVWAAEATTTKIAVVNVQQILETSPRVDKMNEGLRDQYKPQQQALEAEQKTLDEEMNKLKRDKSVMTAEQATELQEKVKKDQEAFMSKATAFQKALQASQQDVMKQVFDSMSAVIESIAKKNGYDIVLDSQAVTYAIDSVNITDAVASEFNSVK